MLPHRLPWSDLGALGFRKTASYSSTRAFFQNILLPDNFIHLDMTAPLIRLTWQYSRRAALSECWSVRRSHSGQRWRRLIFRLSLVEWNAFHFNFTLFSSTASSATTPKMQEVCLRQLSSLSQKRHIQNLVFPDGLVWDKKTLHLPSTLSVIHI